MDPEPTQEELSNLFHSKDEPTFTTLMSLTHYPESDGGWEFQYRDFPVRGTWTVQVTRDLDRDGIVAGELEEGGLLLRIAVLFNDEEIFATVRGRETQG